MPPLALDIEYLNLQVINHLNILDAVSYSHTCHTNRNVVNEHLLEVVRREIGPYFSSPTEYKHFWHVLTLCKGVVSDDMSLAIMQPVSQPRLSPQQLMIFVRRGGGPVITNFIEAIGYMKEALANFHFCPPMSPWNNTRVFTTKTRRIILVESNTSSVLPLVLSSRCTAVMNAITATRLFTFYPTLTLSDHAAVAQFHWGAEHSVDFYSRQGITLRQADEYVPGVACGYECVGSPKGARTRDKESGPHSRWRVSGKTRESKRDRKEKQNGVYSYA
ncbi:hypothetical protein FPV67DRAFT_1674191 [Lyophyllum atratum]|nr:hypothetical protein FPV67DRAFT_1674191 [Lyophyllum atratum]